MKTPGPWFGKQKARDGPRLAYAFGYGGRAEGGRYKNREHRQECLCHGREGRRAAGKAPV